MIKESPEQVRFDSPIPVEVEVKSGVSAPERLKRDIEDKVRELLTVKIEVNLVAPGTIERTQYKTPLIRIRK